MAAFFESLESYKLGSVSLATLLNTALLLLLCVVVGRILLAIASRLLSRGRLEPGLRDFLRQALRVTLWFLTILIVAGSLGIQTASLVAVFGVVGLALSLSIQGLLSNLFSGITLLGIKPFVIGNYVDIGGMAGTVTAVGLFYTTLTTLDNKVVFIPNGDVTASKVVNYSREPTRRVELRVRADYGTDAAAVTAALLEAARGTAQALADPAPFAGISEFQESTAEYLLWVWVQGGDFIPAGFALRDAVCESFARHGIRMAYPHVQVHLSNLQ